MRKLCSYFTVYVIGFLWTVNLDNVNDNNYFNFLRVVKSLVNRFHILSYFFIQNTIIIYITL